MKGAIEILKNLPRYIHESFWKIKRNIHENILNKKEV